MNVFYQAIHCDAFCLTSNRCGRAYMYKEGLGEWAHRGDCCDLIWSHCPPQVLVYVGLGRPKVSRMSAWAKVYWGAGVDV